jgi:hypothetical protein
MLPIERSTSTVGLVGFRVMTYSTPTRRLAGLLAILLMAFLTAGLASGEDDVVSWDSAVVTKLANELEKTLDEALDKSRSAPDQPTAFQQRERDAAQGRIRRSRELGADYARRMRAGWSREDSEPYFRGVADSIDQIWETAGDAVPAPKAQPLVDRLHAIVDELRAQYDSEFADD